MKLRDLIENLKNPKIYKFEEPWRVSSKALSFVVPIIKLKPSKREYLVAEEVQDKIELLDSGSINEVKVKGDINKPVFFRAGGILQGLGTQSRTVQHGIVAIPTKEQTIKVMCIHASHPISTGRKFRIIRRIAPRPVMNALAYKNQSMVWNAVNYYARTASSTLANQPFIPSSDNLVETIETVSRFRKDVEKKLEKIPATMQNQVGVAILDSKGVVGLEVFDHPDSWKAFSKSIIRHYEDVLTEESETALFEIKTEQIFPAILKFLTKAENLTEHVIWTGENSQTLAVKGEELVGEYTLLNNKIIHFILTRKEPTYEPTFYETYTPIRYSETNTTSNVDWSGDSTSWTTQWISAAPSRYFRRKDALTFLSSLENGEKTWKQLEPKFRSTRTLAKRAKEAVSYGLAQRTIRSTNGKPVYKLTAQGKHFLQSVKHKNIKV